MWKTWKRWWKYMAVKLRVRQEELADPKVQMVQAMEEARLAHRRATEQAAIVIANYRVAQKRLGELTVEHEKLRVTADQALLLAERQRQSGDAGGSTGYEDKAETMVVRVMELEHDVTNQQLAVQQAAVAADQAKAKVVQNAQLVREKMRDAERVLNDLERAKMLEALNEANDRLDNALDDDGPTFESVAQKVDNRLERAIARGDIAAAQLPSAQQAAREVDQAVKAVQARAFLDERRAMLGLPPASPVEPFQVVRNDDDDVLDVPPPRRRQGA